MNTTLENLPVKESRPRGRLVRTRWARNALTFLMVAGPGLIVMEADNDAGAVSTYVQAGAEYGTHLLWLLLLLLPITYFVQEMVVRLGIATGEGHAAMIYKRFGKWWGRFSLVDLQLVNFMTLVTEFAAIDLAFRKMGIPLQIGVPISAVALVLLVMTGSYVRWGAYGRISVPNGCGVAADRVPAATGNGGDCESRGAAVHAARWPHGWSGISRDRDRRHHDRALAAFLSAELRCRQASAVFGFEVGEVGHFHWSLLHHHRRRMHDAGRQRLEGPRSVAVGSAMFVIMGGLIARG